MRSKLFLSILVSLLSVAAFSQDISETALTGKWIPDAIKLPSGVVKFNAEALTAVFGKDQAAGLMEMKKMVYEFKKNTYEFNTVDADKGKYEITRAGKKILFTNDKTKAVTEVSVWFENGMLVVQSTLEDGAQQTIYYKKS